MRPPIVYSSKISPYPSPDARTTFVPRWASERSLLRGGPPGPTEQKRSELRFCCAQALSAAYTVAGSGRKGTARGFLEKKEWGSHAALSALPSVAGGAGLPTGLPAIVPLLPGPRPTLMPCWTRRHRSRPWTGQSTDGRRGSPGREREEGDRQTGDRGTTRGPMTPAHVSPQGRNRPRRRVRSRRRGRCKRGNRTAPRAPGRPLTRSV